MRRTIDPTGGSDVGPAIQSALSGGGRLVLPGPGQYRLATPVVVPNGAGLTVDPGANVVVPNLGPTHAITVGPSATMTLDGHLVGPGGGTFRNGAVTTGNLTGGILVQDSALLTGAGRIEGFLAGISLVGNHQKVAWIKAIANLVGVWFGPGGTTFADQHLLGVDLTGNFLASWAVDPDNIMDAVKVIGGHSGFSPYGIYAPARPSGVPRKLMNEVRFLGHRFEALGNGLIFDQTRSRDLYDVRFDGGWSGWDPAYRATTVDGASAARDYLLDVGPMLGVQISGANLMTTPGTVGIVRSPLMRDVEWLRAGLPASGGVPGSGMMGTMQASGKPIVTVPSGGAKGVYLRGDDGRFYDTSYSLRSR